MAERVFLHIGAPKAGTTYLQTVLWSNQQALADAGTLLPGKVRFDHNQVAQFARSDSPSHAATRTWRRVQRQISGWSGDAVISNEWLTMASQAQAARVVEQLRPSEVHVVFTARNFLSAVPSAWQQTLKVGLSQPLETFIDSLATAGEQERWTWSHLDPALVLQRWSSVVPTENIHVVTVPPRRSDPHLLWKRFASACAIAPGCCDLAESTGNESLGAESARLLQLVGPRLRAAIDADDGPWREPHRWIRSLVADHTLVPTGGHKIALREDEEELLRGRNQESALVLRNAGYDVIGDLDELTRETPRSGAAHPDDVDPTEVIDRAGIVIAALLRRARDEKHRADRNAARVRKLQRRADGPRRPGSDRESSLDRLRIRRLPARVARRLRAAADRHRR